MTGAAGFIGAHLVRTLAARGASVVGIDGRLPPSGLPGDHLQLDLANPDVAAPLGEVLRHAGVVFHLAALPGMREAGPDLELRRWRDNVEAPRACSLSPRHRRPSW